MKRTSYTFAVLRYVHDIVGGEFVNVGIVLFAPESRYLGIACTTTYGRISKFFGDIEGDHLIRLLRHVEAGIDEISSRIRDQLPFDNLTTRIVTDWISSVLPSDDSSLQFSAAAGGLTGDPQAALEDLYKRYVEQYSQKILRSSRLDEEIWPIFRKSLAEKNVLAHLKPKKIVAKDYEHEFPYSWQNGVWNTCEAVSFDLEKPDNIVEKANRWVGRAVSLADSSEEFKLYLLLGKPSSEKLLESFYRAKNILNKMSCPHQLILEDQAQEFADLVKEQVSSEKNGH
jgi:hypothetical protein